VQARNPCDVTKLSKAPRTALSSSTIIISGSLFNQPVHRLSYKARFNYKYAAGFGLQISSMGVTTPRSGRLRQFAPHTSARRCRSLQASGIPSNDPCRSRHRFHPTRSGPVGLPTRRDAGLLPARQADRQCIHRSVQRPLPGGMPQRPLVPEPCRRVEKSGGLA
jgi:hypothetical protein